MCPNFGMPNIINFTFRMNGKFIFLGVPILRHFTVFTLTYILGLFACLHQPTEHRHGQVVSAHDFGSRGRVPFNSEILPSCNWCFIALSIS